MAEQEQTVDQQQEKAREKAEDDRYQRAEQQQAAYDDEYESRRETLSALALFQQDSVEQLAGGSRQNRRDYYQKLLSRLYIELRDLGASMLLDQLDAQLTQKHQGKCAMLVYSAVTQCYQMLVLDAPMADAANAVPDVFTAEREPMTWELLASYSADPELPVRASFTTRVRVLRSVSRLLYQARRDGRSAAPEEDALRARLQEYQLMAKMQDESLENAARQVEEANRKAEEARTGRRRKPSLHRQGAPNSKRRLDSSRRRFASGWRMKRAGRRSCLTTRGCSTTNCGRISRGCRRSRTPGCSSGRRRFIRRIRGCWGSATSAWRRNSATRWIRRLRS